MALLLIWLTPLKFKLPILIFESLANMQMAKHSFPMIQKRQKEDSSLSIFLFIERLEFTLI